jgi:hypothetical protein
MAKAPIKQVTFIGPQILYLKSNVLKARNPLFSSNISSYCLLGLQLSQWKDNVDKFGSQATILLVRWNNWNLVQIACMH